MYLRRMFLGLAACSCLVWGGMEASFALIPPKSGVAAPPVSARDASGRFDPYWASHRGQVMLVLYQGSGAEIPFETIQRVNDWQSRLGPRGLQVVVILEGSSAEPTDLSTSVIFARDESGATRERYQITEDREYFIVDRYGRLRRQRINESAVQRALSDVFDPSWVGYSGSWNQTYFVHRGETLFYLADTQPDSVGPGESFDLRLIALPTFSVPRPGSQIHSPVRIDVRTEGGFEQETYTSELEEPIQVSTELLLGVKTRADIEPGFHVLWVHVNHQHCGFGNCAGYEQTIPVPVWVE